MNKPNGIYPDDSNKEISFIDLNQPVTILMASPSKFFLEGIHRGLRNDKGLTIAWEVQNQEELEKSLERIKPDILFIDNRALKFDIRKILTLINSGTRLILLGDRPTARIAHPNVTYVTRHTSSSELILVMRKSLYRTMAINIEEYKPSAISSLTPNNMDEPETIIDLTDEVLFEEGDEIKLFDNEIGLEENISIDTINDDFDHLDSSHYQVRRRNGYSRLRALSQLSLFVLLALGFIYIGAKYNYLDSGLGGFISFNLFRPTDPKIESEIKMALSEQGFPYINVSVNEGKAVLSGKVENEEEYSKASMIAREVKGVKDIESHLVVEKTVTHSDSTPDLDEIEFLQHYNEPEENNDEKVTYLDTYKNAKKDEPNPEKIMDYSKSIPNQETTQTLQPSTNQEPEKEISRKVSSQDVKNGIIKRSSVEKEANESRRLQVLSELQNEVKRKEVVEVIRTGQEEPREPEDDDRVSALPSSIDAAIARDIEKALADEGYKDIKVSVENGEVFLIGEVKTHQEHIRLHRIALRTSGVKKVKSILGISEYSNMQ